MSFLTTKEGVKIFYKDWGNGPVIVFSHGWPLSSDAWDAQMLYFGQQGYRVVAHDRRGHGLSEATWNGNTMDQFADDLGELITMLDLKDIVLVGHSMGGGEVARYIGRHGTSRVKKVVLLAAVPPIMLKSESNPGGTPMEMFDSIRKGVAENRSQFYQELAVQFYGFNKLGSHKSQGLIDSFWHLGLSGSVKAQYDCVAQFSETDFTEDLKKIDVPTLIAHGDGDQIVPIADSAELSAQIAPQATLKVYHGGSHGLAQTQPDDFNQDLLAFIKA